MKIMVSACLLPCAVREELADAVRARHLFGLMRVLVWHIKILRHCSQAVMRKLRDLCRQLSGIHKTEVSSYTKPAKSFA